MQCLPGVEWRGRVAGIVESTVFSDVDSTKHGADANHRGPMGRSDTDVAMAVATRAIGAGARPKNVDVGEREQCSSGREQDDTPLERKLDIELIEQ